jgi:hypothetical protein
MVLQTVNKNRQDHQASSLCCVWMRRDLEPGRPLVCLWIDSTTEGTLRAIGYNNAEEIPAGSAVGGAEDGVEGAVESDFRR